MQAVTQENWTSVIKQDMAILQFSAPWCGPCKSQALVLDEVSSSHNQAFFGKVDIEDNIDIAENFKVRSVPTIVLLKNGKENQRFVGFQTKQKLEAALCACETNCHASAV